MAFEHEHSTRPMEDHWADMTRLVSGALTYYTSTGTGPGLEKWRTDPKDEVAEKLAIFISAGMVPSIDRRVGECVMGTLALLQRPRDIHMRPRDPAEERRLFWRPDQAAQARAVELLAARPDGTDLYAFIPMVQPGKAFGVWAHGQEVITVRPAVVLGPRSYVAGDGYACALKQALGIALAALNSEPGTAACALVMLDGSTVVIEAGPDGGFATSEQQEDA